MDLRGQEIKNTYGNVVTIGSSAGSPTTGELTNGQNSSFTASFVSGDFGVGITPNNYANLNTLTIGSAAASAGGIIDFTGTSGRLASIYTEASGKIVLAADPTNGEAGTALEFNVDGSNAMLIDSSRNVGIGVVPTNNVGNVQIGGTVNTSIFSQQGTDTVRLGVRASGRVGIAFDSSDPTYTNRMWYLDSIGSSGTLTIGRQGLDVMTFANSGKVGIGTSSPAAKLEVEQATSGEGLRIDGASGGFALVVEGGSSYKSILRNASIGTSYFGNTAPTDGLIVEGNVGIGTANPTYSLDIEKTTGEVAIQLQARDDSSNTAIYFGDNSDSDVGSLIYNQGSNYMSFTTNAGERMRITPTGSVGIGTSSPERKLSIGSAHSDGIQFSYDATNNYRSQILTYWNSNADSRMDFNIARSSGQTPETIMSVGYSTNVGIGTTTPETKLDVDGDIQTAAPETSTNAAWKLGNVGLGGVEVGPIDYITVSVGGFVVKLPIAIFPETQAFYDRVIADGGTFEGLLGYESAVTILKAQ